MQRATIASTALILIAACRQPDRGAEPRVTAPPGDAAADAVDTSYDDAPLAPDWWKRGAAACPPGGRIQGAPPPQGVRMGCVDSFGREHGPVAQWGEGGRLVAVARSVHGLPRGKQIYFHPDGTRMREGSIIDLARQGVWTEWHPNGQVFTSGPWDHGKPDGEHRYFARDGHLLGTVHLTHGTGRWVVWNQDGVKVEEFDYVAGQPHGAWIAWFPGGAKAKEGRYQNGLRHGETTVWDEQGHKLAVESHERGLPSGTWTWWDRQGVITLVKRFDMDVETLAIAYDHGRPLAAPPPPTKCDTQAGLFAAHHVVPEGPPLPGLANRCVRRVPSIPGLVMIGSPGAGGVPVPECLLLNHLWDCVEHNGPPRSQDALARGGWAGAPAAHRQLLALTYLRDVLHAGDGEIIPSNVTTADGSVVVTYWLNTWPGFQKDRERRQIEARFDRTGALTEKTLRTEAAVPPSAPP